MAVASVRSQAYQVGRQRAQHLVLRTIRTHFDAWVRLGQGIQSNSGLVLTGQSCMPPAARNGSGISTPHMVGPRHIKVKLLSAAVIGDVELVSRGEPARDSSLATMASHSSMHRT